MKNNNELEDKVCKQIEFYFSDSNLPKDKFLRSLVANHPEGYVEVSTISSFKRVQSLTTDNKKIISSIKKSKMLELDKEEKLVRRSTPLPENNTYDQRTAYVKGFPIDTTLDFLLGFFPKFGEILSVRMIKTLATIKLDDEKSKKKRRKYLKEVVMLNSQLKRN